MGARFSGVRPLLKKLGLELSSGNYRPVSNLPFLSKLLEKCVFLQFTEHWNKESHLPNRQSAYRKNHSFLLIRIVNDCLWEMENPNASLITAIDLSVAFDTVDHNILLEVLNKRFGIEGQPLHWVETYLRPRAFQVNVGDKYSQTQESAILYSTRQCQRA